MKRARTFATSLSLLLILLLAFQFFWLDERRFAASQSSVVEFEMVSGADLVVGVPEASEIVGWERQFNIVFNPLISGPAPATLSGLSDAASVYPAGSLSRICPKVYLVQGILFSGEPAGGTAGKGWVAIAGDPTWTDTTLYETAKLGIHHECSSLIWSIDSALQKEWNTFFDSDWPALADGSDQLKIDQKQKVDFSTGSLSAYGKTSPENDFNTYAEWLFDKPEKLGTVSDKYPIVRTKALLIACTYLKIIPELVRHLEKSNVSLKRC